MAIFSLLHVGRLSSWDNSPSGNSPPFLVCDSYRALWTALPVGACGALPHIGLCLCPAAFAQSVSSHQTAWQLHLQLLISSDRCEEIWGSAVKRRSRFGLWYPMVTHNSLSLYFKSTLHHLCPCWGLSTYMVYYIYLGKNNNTHSNFVLKRASYST